MPHKRQTESLAASAVRGLTVADIPADISEKLSFLRSFGAVRLTEEKHIFFCKIKWKIVKKLFTKLKICVIVKQLNF